MKEYCELESLIIIIIFYSLIINANSKNIIKVWYLQIKDHTIKLKKLPIK